jgi:hypothetical protein
MEKRIFHVGMFSSDLNSLSKDQAPASFVERAALQLLKINSSSNDQTSEFDKAKPLVKKLTSADARNAAADEEKKNVQIIEDACKHVNS